MTDAALEAAYRARLGVFCGVDEAGRGPLAGPVYAAAVILPPDTDIIGIDDSKKLSAKRREAMYEVVVERSSACASAYATVAEIEEYNILNAAQLAMRRAISALMGDICTCAELLKQGDVPAAAVIDGNIARDMPVRAETLVGADALLLSVAAASIIAKVSRDRVMRALDEKYPMYGFAKHSGYGTRAHIAALLEYGPCPEHRASFIAKILSQKK